MAATQYVLVDEHNSWEGETFGLAFPVNDTTLAALNTWQETYKAWAKRYSDFHPSLRWDLTPRTREYLAALNDGADNGYSDRVSYLSPEGVAIVVGAVSTLPSAPATLSLYKGNLERLVGGDSEGAADEIADLWRYCHTPDPDPEDPALMDRDGPRALVLVKYSQDFRRMGSLAGVFTVTRAELAAMKAVGQVYLDEALGKHSEVYAALSDETLTVLTDDQEFIRKARTYGLDGTGCDVYSGVYDVLYERYEDFLDALSAEDAAVIAEIFDSARASNGDGDDDDDDDDDDES